MSSSTRTLFAVIAIVAIATAWAWVGCLTLEKRIPDWLYVVREAQAQNLAHGVAPPRLDRGMETTSG